MPPGPVTFKAASAARATKATVNTTAQHLLARGIGNRACAGLNEIIALYERAGVMMANPHGITREDGSRHKTSDADQLGFKHEVDPQGLLNPGKMRSFVPVPVSPTL